MDATSSLLAPNPMEVNCEKVGSKQRRTRDDACIPLHIAVPRPAPQPAPKPPSKGDPKSKKKKQV